MLSTKTIILLLEATVLLCICRINTSAQETKIGAQTWATSNLNVSTFRNGDAIPEANTKEEWVKAVSAGKPAWCYYEKDPTNGEKLGRLYNWFTVSDLRGLAPNGWHVPSDEEWIILIDYLGGEEIAGLKMKNTTGWEDYKGKNGNGTNESGFAGLPGGFSNGSG